MKRALRYFGRALAAFAFTIIGFGLQAIVALGFLKGLIILCVGGWTLYTISYYGMDIGTKFHLAIGRAVKAEFDLGISVEEESEEAAGRGGSAVSSRSMPTIPEHNTQAHFAQSRSEHRRRVAPVTCLGLPCFWHPRTACSSAGGVSTLHATDSAKPLWRLDEMAILPYHQNQLARDQHGRLLPKEQVQGLIMRLQGQEPQLLPPASQPQTEGIGRWLEALGQVAETGADLSEADARPWWAWWPRGAGGEGGGTVNRAPELHRPLPRPDARAHVQLHDSV